jgi:hypothetical protein
MPLCEIVEKNKPACAEQLDAEGVCPVHCRADTPQGPCKRHHKPGLRHCYQHVTLLDARAAVVQRIQSGGESSTLLQAAQAFEELAEAQVEQKRDAALKAIQRLGHLLRSGAADAGESNVQFEVVTVALVERLFQFVADVLRRHVTDPEAVAEIESGLLKLAGEAGDSLLRLRTWTTPARPDR